MAIWRSGNCQACRLQPQRKRATHADRWSNALVVRRDVNPRELVAHGTAIFFEETPAWHDLQHDFSRGSVR
ncbi:MAG TPA: hypothetical protein VGJ20_26325 [Xanthobacteraceae bacterium]|jgi:hypothetical protein